MDQWLRNAIAPRPQVKGKGAGPLTAKPPPMTEAQACRPRDGGRRPLTCKTPGKTPPYTTPRGTHPRQPSRLVEPGACRPKARHSSRHPRPAGTGRGPPKVTPKGPSGVCPRARHVLTPRSLRSLRRGPGGALTTDEPTIQAPLTPPDPFMVGPRACKQGPPVTIYGWLNLCPLR